MADKSITLSQSENSSSTGRKFTAYVTGCNTKYYEGSWAVPNSYTGIGVSIDSTYITLWNTNSTNSDVKYTFTWTSSKLSTCKKTLEVTASKVNCPDFNVVLVTVFNDDSDGLLESVSGNVQLSIYSIVGSGGTYVGVICSNDINEVGETKSQSSSIPNNCSGVDNVKFIFDNVDLTCSFSENIANFTVSGDIEYRLGGRGSYTTLSSVNNYTVSTTSNSATIGKCDIEDTTLWTMMDGSKILYLKHTITMNYDKTACEYKIYIYTSPQSGSLTYGGDLNVDGKSGSDLTDIMLNTNNCTAIANVCGNNVTYIDLSLLNISINGNYYIGSTKFTRNMVKLVTCTSLPTHFQLYTTDVFADAVDNVTNNFDITVPIVVSYDTSPTITYNVNFVKTDYATCPTASFSTTSTKCDIYSTTTVYVNVTNWGNVTSGNYNSWGSKSGNNLKIIVDPDYDKNYSYEIGDYESRFKQFSVIIRHEKAIPCSDNSLDDGLKLHLKCVSSNKTLSSVTISPNYGNFVTTFNKTLSSGNTIEIYIKNGNCTQTIATMNASYSSTTQYKPIWRSALDMPCNNCDNSCTEVSFTIGWRTNGTVAIRRITANGTPLTGSESNTFSLKPCTSSDFNVSVDLY